MKRLRSLSSSNAVASRNFNVLIRKGCRMRSQEFLTRTEETVENMRSPLRKSAETERRKRKSKGEGERVQMLKWLERVGE